MGPSTILCMHSLVPQKKPSLRPFNSKDGPSRMMEKLSEWKDAPGGRIYHPREEHLLPLFMVAAAGAASNANAQLIYDTIPKEEDQFLGATDHAVTGYLFA